MRLTGFAVLLCCSLPLLFMGLLMLGNPEVRGFFWDMLDNIRHWLRLPPRKRYPERVLTLFAILLLIFSASFAVIALNGQSVTLFLSEP